MSDFDPSAGRVLQDLRTRYPRTSFLALGQTVWWDEPLKASLRLMLDSMGLGGHMVLGVHDTDYFARVKVRQAGQARYELMPHNDGSTKDLWSAAGEISRLFGSESFPTRHDYALNGVALDWLARNQGKDRQAFVNEVTEAWGWRGLVYTGSRDLIVHTLPLSDVGPAIERMLEWGFEGALESIVDDCCRTEARKVADRLLGWVREYRDTHPDAMLSDLYQHVFPRMFELLLGAPPSDVSVDCTAHLLRLNPSTASLPRFEFVDLFLNEKTRRLAAQAYNHAVEGSEMYTLDKFGLGAVPFDVVTPEQGRGTLRVTLRAIHVETRHPVRIPLKQPVTSVQELAAVLADALGDHVTLVGKAVALISMMAREFIFVFNEEGSGYVCRTRAMNDYLRSHGVALAMHPILRLHYRTWDALSAGRARITLPDFLSAAFGASQVPSADVAARWRGVVEEQGRALEEAGRLRSPRHLLALLARGNGQEWRDRLAAYEEAKRALRETWRQAAEVQEQVRAAWRELREVKADIRDTERRKGDHFRATTDWTPAENAKRASFDAQIAQLLVQRRRLMGRIRDLKAHRMAIERGPDAERARQRVEQVAGDAEMARLQMVRHAILTRKGLPHTDHRPTGWWLPMVDPSGEWFRRIARTAQVYIQPIVSDD